MEQLPFEARAAPDKIAIERRIATTALRDEVLFRTHGDPGVRIRQLAQQSPELMEETT